MAILISVMAWWAAKGKQLRWISVLESLGHIASFIEAVAINVYIKILRGVKVCGI